jgi:hypothetical protein
LLVVEYEVEPFVEPAVCGAPGVGAAPMGAGTRPKPPPSG